MYIQNSLNSFRYCFVFALELWLKNIAFTLELYSHHVHIRIRYMYAFIITCNIHVIAHVHIT